MSNINIFKAVGYHGTNEDSVNSFLENNIDCTYRRNQDIFLGGGFYLWRDSYYRAYNWSARHSDGNDNAVLEVNVKCNNEEMLNFTTTSSGQDNKELKFLKLYLKVVEALQESGHNGLYFGRFIDYLIDTGVDIKLVSVHDLTHDLKLFVLQDPSDGKNKTHFALGDIQMCIKDDTLIQNKQKVSCENS